MGCRPCIRVAIPLFLGGKKVIVIQEITRRAGLKNLILDTPPAHSDEDVGRFAVDCTNGLGLSSTDLKLLELVAASTAQSTRHAYDSDVRHFLAWGGTVPATSLTVARYLAAHATVLSAATLARRLVAIGRAHTLKAFPNSTKADIVRLTMRGIRRTHGVPQRRVAALTTENVFAITSLLGNALVDVRDRALLLVGFAGALRRSELVAIDYEWVRWSYMGLWLRFPEASLIKKVVAGKSSFPSDVRRRARLRPLKLGCRPLELLMGRYFVRCRKEVELDQSGFRRMPLPRS
jgi:integrase